MTNQIQIKRIIEKNAKDANMPNEPFLQWGRMVPALFEGQWSYRTEDLKEPSELCFPDFPYDPSSDPNAWYFGAYDGEECVGLAVLRKDMFRYLYLDDLKVKSSCRGKKIGSALIAACMEEGEKQDMVGVYTIAQDNNLSACLFYLKNCFEIGGFDNRSYKGTPQEHKANIFFYRDCRKG